MGQAEAAVRFEEVRDAIAKALGNLGLSGGVSRPYRLRGQAPYSPTTYPAAAYRFEGDAPDITLAGTDERDLLWRVAIFATSAREADELVRLAWAELKKVRLNVQFEGEDRPRPGVHVQRLRVSSP